MVSLLKILCNIQISLGNWVDKKARSINLTDEQWFLDWQDSLNEISVR